MSCLVGFSGDEALILVVCSAISALGLWKWTASLRPVSKLGAPRGMRLPLYVAVAHVLTGPHDRGHGWREVWVKDPDGCTWAVDKATSA